MIFDPNKIISECTEDITNLKICLLSKESSGKKALKKYFSFKDKKEELDIVNINTIFRSKNLKKKIFGFIDLENKGDFFSPLKKEIYKTSDLILILLEDEKNLLNNINKWISEFDKEEIIAGKCILVNSVN